MGCVICGCPDLDRGVDYSWCPECRTVRTDYPYDSNVYDEAYAENYRRLAATPLNKTINRSRLELVERFVSPHSTILDVGCGMGEFVKMASRCHPCIGWEPNINQHFSSLNGNRNLGAITFFDVFEHFEDPRQAIVSFRRRMSPGGVIVMVMPNVDAVPFGDHAALIAWKHFKPREHLFLYSLEGLEHLAARALMRVAHYDYEESNLRPNNPNKDLIRVVMQ